MILLFLKIRDLNISATSFFEILNTLFGNLGYFFAAIALLFLNYFLEVKKWKLLTESIERRTFSEATQDVLRGLRVGVFTPFMIGDFLGRSFGFGKNNKTEAVAVNLFNSVCQTYIAIFFGAFAFFVWWWVSMEKLQSLLFYPMITLLLMAVLGLWFVFNLRISWNFLLKIRFFQDYINANILEIKLSKNLILKVLLLSLARNLVFNIQFILFFLSFGLGLSKWLMFVGVNLILLVKTIGGGLNIFGDLTLRQFVSLHFFGIYNVDATLILLVTFTVWFFNIFVPIALGLFIKTKR